MGARIAAISETGEVVVKFNQTMVIPSIYANVSQKRLSPDYNETIHEFLSLRVLSGIETEFANRTKILKFNLTDFDQI